MWKSSRHDWTGYGYPPSWTCSAVRSPIQCGRGGGPLHFFFPEKINNDFAPLGCLANARHLLVDKPDVVFRHASGQPRSYPVVWSRMGSPCIDNCFFQVWPPLISSFLGLCRGMTFMFHHCQERWKIWKGGSETLLRTVAMKCQKVRVKKQNYRFDVPQTERMLNFNLSIVQTMHCG